MQLTRYLSHRVCGVVDDTHFLLEALYGRDVDQCSYLDMDSILTNINIGSKMGCNFPPYFCHRHHKSAPEINIVIEVE